MINHKGTKKIKTQRLILRKFKITDAEYMFNNWAIVPKEYGKVMLKAGMEYEGRLRKYNKNNVGKLVDCDMYSILKEDLAKGVTDEN